MDSRIFEKDADHLVAVWNQTVIHIWRGAPTAASVGSVVKACNMLLSIGQGEVTCIGIVERTSPPPDEGARAALAKWSHDVVPRMAGAVFVADGGGFRAALVRGVGVALTTLMPHRVPFKFYGELDEALQDLAPKIKPGTGGILALRATIEILRSQLS